MSKIFLIWLVVLILDQLSYLGKSLTSQYKTKIISEENESARHKNNTSCLMKFIEGLKIHTVAWYHIRFCIESIIWIGISLFWIHAFWWSFEEFQSILLRSTVVFDLSKILLFPSFNSMTFDLCKIIDLSKKFALPDTLLKSKNYCNSYQKNDKYSAFAWRRKHHRVFGP